ncbi:MAG: hypothetical protein K1X67_26040, partial [Fimbriimonadaceae bacterium]|nr:hypothetical protein [Fimbriimonadaceae bacterium]
MTPEATHAAAGSKRWTGRGWSVEVHDAVVVVEDRVFSLRLEGDELRDLRVGRSWFRWRLVRDSSVLARLRGLSSQQAEEMGRAIARLPVLEDVTAAVAWRTAVQEALENGKRQGRWIPNETTERLLASRPERGLSDRIHAAGCSPVLTEDELEAAAFLETDVPAVVRDANESIM